MNPVEAIETVVTLLGKFPDLIEAVEHAITAVKNKQDPTPAVKHAQRLAAEKFLGIEAP